MKLAIVGSRRFNDYERMEKFLFENLRIDYITEIVSGGAKGADKLAEKFATNHKIPITVFYPKWDELGKRAGYVRNIQIVDNSDFLVAFWDGESKGTRHSIDLGNSRLGEDNVKICRID